MDKRALPTRAQVVVVPDTSKQDDGNSICAVPVVIVSSEYVPSELAVHVPVTWRDSVTDAVAQPRSVGTIFTLPLTFRHDDVTDQVPTTVPPQGVTLGQLEPPPVAAPLPPVAVVPPVAGIPPVAVSPPLLDVPPVAVVPPAVVTPPVLLVPPVDVAPPVPELPPVDVAPALDEVPPVGFAPPVWALPPLEPPPWLELPPVAEAPAIEEPPVFPAPAVDPPVSVDVPPEFETPPVDLLPARLEPPVPAALALLPPVAALPALLEPPDVPAPPVSAVVLPLLLPPQAAAKRTMPRSEGPVNRMIYSTPLPNVVASATEFRHAIAGRAAGGWRVARSKNTHAASQTTT